MTHDSIGIGEDGPTHQPIEQLASFRAMPHMCIIRPADANEVAYAWRAAMMRRKGPTMLVLTRQKLPVLARRTDSGAEGVLRGAYTLSKENKERPDLLLLASGSEVHLILEAQSRLAEEGIMARVVSMPSWELFREQAQEYREQVLPPECRGRVAVEAGSPLGWHEWVGSHGEVIAVSKFGASAPYKSILENYGFTVDRIVEKAKQVHGNVKQINGKRE
jgi:transketolase